MNISGIKDSVVSAVSAGFTATGNFVSWCGHKVSSGFNNYLVPAVQALWAKIAPAAQKSANFMRTGWGVSSVLAGLGVAGIVATWWPKSGAELTIKNADGNVDYVKVGKTVASVVFVTAAVGVAAYFRGARVI